MSVLFCGRLLYFGRSSPYVEKGVYSRGNSPVRSGSHGNGLGANLEREQLARHDPGARAPRTGEEEDVYTDESDEDLVGDNAARDSTDNRDNVLAGKHADGAK